MLFTVLFIMGQTRGNQRKITTNKANIDLNLSPSSYFEVSYMAPLMYLGIFADELEMTEPLLPTQSLLPQNVAQVSSARCPPRPMNNDEV